MNTFCAFALGLGRSGSAESICFGGQCRLLQNSREHGGSRGESVPQGAFLCHNRLCPRFKSGYRLRFRRISPRPICLDFPGPKRSYGFPVHLDKCASRSGRPGAHKGLASSGQEANPIPRSVTNTIGSYARRVMEGADTDNDRDPGGTNKRRSRARKVPKSSEHSPAPVRYFNSRTKRHPGVGRRGLGRLGPTLPEQRTVQIGIIPKYICLVVARWAAG
ncbi:hypothetical protein B0H15DRAFT_462666 [Mycena belliarum]|uniref:Uncharacterized protein n=1 Tax=Mycena belliarum TaxID=1033014 RepID=A0AAD6XWE2_9AGAR|nr:hypothetical protein B0H15DRAFT_462666 [Mycena belliae]